jgi:hypothetical protein
MWLDNVSLISLAQPSVCSLYDADYSDLDSSYNLAWHTGDGALRLGALWTADSSFARGDDDASDDGITLDSNTTWQEGSTVGIFVDVTGGSGYLAGWFDWNDDGDFDDPLEKSVAQNVSNGSNSIDFTIPSGAGYSTQGRNVQARFRLYASEPTSAPLGNETPTGGAASGEVEDYELTPQGPTAVNLSSFNASALPNGVLVTWETSLEIDNLGFNLYRAETEDGAAIRINDNLIPSQAPGGLTGASYTYMDHSAAPYKTYYYWLEMLQIDGSRLRFGPIVAIPPDEEMKQLFLPLIIH